MSLRRVVTVGGPPGSGKSTAGRAVAAELGLEYVSAGDRFREEARERGMDLEAFGAYAEAHPEVDRSLDAAMRGLARPGRLLDGRVQGALLRRAGVPIHALVVTADRAERARRLAARDHESVEVATGRLATREASEATRYRRLYGLDLDREPADLTVDSTDRPAAEVARAIVSFLLLSDRDPVPR